MSLPHALVDDLARIIDALIDYEILEKDYEQTVRAATADLEDLRRCRAGLVSQLDVALKLVRACREAS